MVKSAHTTKAPKIGFDGLSPSKALPTLCEGRKLTAKQNSYRAFIIGVVLKESLLGIIEKLVL